MNAETYTDRVMQDWRDAEQRTAKLEAALKLIASGMQGDRILEAWELSDIAARAVKD